MLEIYEYNFRAMGSPCSLNLYCHSSQQFADICLMCEHEVQRLEQKYSRYLCNSLLSQINKAAGLSKTFKLDQETSSILQYADTAYQISDGFFDITSGTLRNIWDFKDHSVPNTEKIRDALKLVNWQKVKLSPASFSLPLKGMEIDLGGIVKEYAADVVAEIIRNNNISHGLVDLGGDIVVVGPHPNNTPWQVAISHPESPELAIAKIPLMSGALASSGDYQRFIMLNNEKYSHILNPKTGWPVKGLSAVSVWAPKCVIAGTIATTAMLKGKDKGVLWLNEINCEYIAIDQQMNVKVKTKQY